MKGTVLHVDEQTGLGIVRSENDMRYTFKLSEWKSEESPVSGGTVDFVLQNNRATEIYAINAASLHQKTISSVAQEAPMSGLAIVSAVCGVAGLFIAFVCIPAIICGHIARSQIRNSNGQLKGDAIALLGLVSGYLGLFLGLLVVFFFGAVFGLAWLH